MPEARPHEVSSQPPLINRQAEALRSRYGDRVWRIGLDGGFSCPNRRDGRGRGGCSYCAPQAGRALYLPEGLSSISDQIKSGVDFLRRRYGARLFFPFFQAFSSTFAPIPVLKARYEEALRATAENADDGLRGMVVSTRPDCIDEDKAELLASYAQRGLEVWVELGLQSARDSTLSRVHRGHDYACFLRAVDLLRESSARLGGATRAKGLRVAVHLILGLPGETMADMVETISRIASLRLDGIKFHDLVVPRGSVFASDFLTGEMTLMHPTRLPGLLADCLELLDPSCEVIRLCSDAPKGGFLSPWLRPDKTDLYRAVEAELGKRGTRQGARFSPAETWRFC